MRKIKLPLTKRFFLRPFSIVFPGCKSIRWLVFHTAQPVGGSAAAISQSNNCDFSKGFLRGAVAHFMQNHRLFSQKQFSACCFAAPAHCLQNEDCNPISGQGAMPLVGCGVKPHMVPHASPGSCLCDTNSYFRSMGAGIISLLGCGVKPRIVPHASPGNCLCDQSSNIRKRIQGTALVRNWVKGQCPWCRGEAPHGLSGKSGIKKPEPRRARQKKEREMITWAVWWSGRCCRLPDVRR